MEPSSQNASAARLRDLAAAGVLTPEQSAALERLLRERLPWRLWTERLLLALGAGLLLAGVLFFFAYNWASMPPWQKLGAVELGIVLCAGAAAWRGLDQFTGQIALFAACVLAGVFLAVFGQIYQTGADTFDLFLGWTALILPWVLLARFGALWLLWLALLDLALGFSWLQTNLWHQLHLAEFPDFCAVLAAFNGLALAAREVAAGRGFAWLREEWLRAVPVSLVFAALTAGNWWLIVFSESKHPTALAPLALLLASGLTCAIYRRKLPSLFCLAAMALSLSIALVTLLFRIMAKHWDSGTFLFMALVVLAVFGGAAAWLRHEARAMESAKQPPPP